MRGCRWLCLLAFTVSDTSAQQAREEKLSYLRPTAKGHAHECSFTLQRDNSGWRIVSVTSRGDTKLSVTSRYDDKDRLLAADAVLSKGEQQVTATVEMIDGKARVKRPKDVQEFVVPPGVIVTSAPDWTDTFLLCRRYDRKKGGKQQFTGLWIHPIQAGALLPFTIEHQGSEQIEHAGKKIDVDRYEIRIRGSNPYVAWADRAGMMLRLVSLPFKEGTPNGLVREGYEKSTDNLRPVNRP